FQARQYASVACGNSLAVLAHVSLARGNELIRTLLGGRQPVTTCGCEVGVVVGQALVHPSATGANVAAELLRVLATNLILGCRLGCLGLLCQRISGNERACDYKQCISDEHGVSLVLSSWVPAD